MWLAQVSSVSHGFLREARNWPGSCIAPDTGIGSTFMQMDTFLVWVALLSAVSMLALSKTD